MSLYKSKFGSFSPDGKEFIITEPCLPRPWMNVLSNGTWCYLASHLGGGYSFSGDASVGRITRWHIDGVPRDTVGKFIYVIDKDKNDFWTVNGYPPTKKLDKWECRVGFGYNTINSSQHGIDSTVTYFVPPGNDECELWIVKLTNTSKTTRHLRTINYAELALGNWWEDTSWREFYLLFNRQEVNKDALLTRSTQWVKYVGGWQAANSNANNIPFDKAVFMRSSAPVSGYEGDRYEFIGSYRDLSAPQVCLAHGLKKHVATGRDACEALQHDFTLRPGESAEYVVMLGAIPAAQNYPSALVKKYGTVAAAKKALHATSAYWDHVLSTPRITSPDANLDASINYWYKYQAANLAWWNRNTGYCYFGIYSFGIRDACQDSVHRLPIDPAWVRNQIVNKIMIWQFEDGSYAHGGNFISMTGAKTYHSDDPVNPVFIMFKYINETGDFSILDESAVYAHTSGKKKATIYEHLVHGLDFFFDHFSKRGLPLIMKADWNDALDQVGNDRKGDSVMLAGWAVYCIENFYFIMEQQKDNKRLERYKKRIEALKKAVNTVAWDGAWYQRAMHDDGTVLGSKKNRYGRIFSNPNCFAVVSGIASPARAKTAMASLHRYLDDQYGVKAFSPTYYESDPRAGIVSRFAPGTKENGAVFAHAGMWRVWAECYMGNGDRAWELLHAMMPTTTAKDPQQYRIEPYVRCQFVYSNESDNPGEGSHSWATGSAAWNLVVVWECLYGLRPQLDGLLVDPCFPSHWKKASIARKFRGSTFDISYKNPHGLQKAKSLTITLDGKELEKPLLPILDDGMTHTVIVTMNK